MSITLLNFDGELVVLIIFSAIRTIKGYRYTRKMIQMYGSSRSLRVNLLPLKIWKSNLFFSGL